MNGARALLEMLRAYEVEHVFGLPGETTLGWYAEWKDFPEVKHILTRDERSASYMAEAYARATNKPGIFEAPSPGVTHCAPGVAEAYKGSMPVVFFTSDVPLNYDKRNMLTGCDQTALFQGIVKESLTITDANDIPFLMRRAFRVATSGRPGPVHIRIPQNIFFQEISDPDIYAQKEFSSFPPHRSVAEAQAMREALSLLRDGKAPLLCLGQGALVSQAWDEAARLAERFSMPVGTTMTGKGAFPEEHDLSIGVVGARGGTSFSNSFIETADVIFYVGSNTDSATTDGWEMPSPSSGKRFIQLDISGTDAGNTYHLDALLLGDAKGTLAEMVRIAEAEGYSRKGNERTEIPARRTDFRQSFGSCMCSEEIPLHPMRFVREFADRIPEDSHIVCDPGVGGIFTAAYFQQKTAGRRLYFNYSMGALGYAVPGVVGVAAADPKRCSIALAGDGSLGFSCGELETIARLGWNIKVFLFKNNSFGWIRGETALVHEFEPFATEFGSVDYSKIAEGFGLKAFEVKAPGELSGVLESAFSMKGPAFVTVNVLPEDKLVPPIPRWVKSGKRKGLPCIY